MDPNLPFWDDDYAVKQPSPRESLARNLVIALKANGLNVSEPEHGDNNRCWRFVVRPTRSDIRPVTTSLGVQVFSPEYIAVIWQERYDQEPTRVVFGDDINAEAFVLAMLVVGDRALAGSVPQWQSKRKPKSPTTSAREASARPGPSQTSFVTEDHFGRGNQPPAQDLE